MHETRADSFAAVNPLMPLDVRGVRLTAGGAALLDGIDLSLEGRGITAIMGPNGAGKTLLLRVLNGLETPDAGRVTWGGRAPDDGVRRQQALLFQKPVLLRRSVAANVDFVLPRQNRTARRDAALARVGLAAKARQPARALSGGEAQRLALARALATDPRVLMLDEPTASLDPGSTAAIERVLTEVAASGTRIILVTHDAGQARRLAQDVVFVSRGRVVEQAPAARFFDAPHSPAARAYLAGRLDLTEPL